MKRTGTYTRYGLLMQTHHIFLPEEAGATDFKKDADVNDLEVAENSVRGKRCHPLGCSLALVSLAELILEDNDLHLPQDPDEAKSLYLDLL